MPSTSADYACRDHDSVVCNESGNDLWGKRDYRQARGFFEVSCGRIKSSLEQNVRRLAQLDAEAATAWRLVEASANGAAANPEESAAALATIGRLKPEGNEIAALMAVKDQGSHLIPGFEFVIGSACDSGKFSREQMAADSQFRAQMIGIIGQGAQNMANTVQTGVAKVEAAKQGIVLQDAAAQGSAAAASAPSGGARPDYGKSCESDGAVTSWKQRCASNPPNQAPCYCAAAATFKCFIAHGCYAEAGAKRSDGQPSDTRRASLEAGVQDSAGKAAQLGTTCP